LVSDIPAGDRKIDNLFYSVALQMKAHFLLTEEKQNSLGENHHSWRKKLVRKSQRAVKISEWLKITESCSCNYMTVPNRAALGSPEPVFVNVYGAQESIPKNRFRQPM
jgi:hypothetical protein